MALGNGLVMIRVVDLWDHHNVRCPALLAHVHYVDLLQMAARLMIGGFIVSYATTIATFLVSISEMFGARPPVASAFCILRPVVQAASRSTQC
jgi:hypothetical protein